MKTNYFILAILLLISSICKSQINYENTYSGNYLSVVVLTNSGYKYVLQDFPNKTVKLYNVNHSLWKTITLSVPSGSTLSFANYVSEKLFNSDALVELIYTYYSSSSVWETKIISENGSVLSTFPGCNNVEAVYTGTNNWKLIVHFTGYHDVYSLPGSMPSKILESNGINNIGTLSNPYPNPTQSITKIDYQLPLGSNSAEMVFYNLNGQVVKRFIIDNTFNSLEINNSDLPSGTYLYHLVTSNDVSAAKQMIVIK